MVHHSTRGFLRYHGPAQRMHGSQVAVKQSAPQRVVNEGAAERFSSLLQPLIHPLENRLVANSGPVQSQVPLLVEAHAAAGIIVCHDQISLGVVYGAVIRPLEKSGKVALLFRDSIRRRHRLGGAGYIRAGCEGARQEHTQRSRRRAFFRHHAVLEPLLVPHVDDSRDARSDGWNLARPVMTPAYAVNHLLGVVAKRQDVSVAREALPESIRQCQAMLRRAEQDLSRAERAGAQHHHIGRDGHERRLELVASDAQQLTLQQPAVGPPLDPSR